MRPPRFPRRLLAWLLPARVREPLLRDLDEEFARDIVPARGAFGARLWYWRQAIGSLVPALRLRRGATVPVSRQSSRRAVAANRIAATCRDVRFGVRRLRREPAFAVAAIATLAIGIGATTSIFALTHAVLLSDLPFRDPDRLISVAEVDTRRALSSGNVSYPDFLDYLAQNTTFEAMAAYTGGSRTIVDGSGLADRVQMAEVTGGFFGMLGVVPALGRDFTDADSASGAPPVVILSDGAWRRRFGADPAIVGRTIQMGPQRPTVVGVLPAEFEFPLRGLAELWLPVQPTAAQRERRYMHWLDLIGRLRPGMELAAARSDLDVIAARFASVDPRYHPAARVSVEPLHERVAGPVRDVLLALQAAAAFLLIVACANIASLLLARGLVRVPELRVRAAVGADRSRLVGQLLAESVALGLPGAIAGLAIAVIAVRAYVASLPPAQQAALPNASGIGLSPELMLTAAGLALAAAIAFGIAPAWQAGRRGLSSALRVRAGLQRGDLRLQSIFVAAQLALALVLLAGAGLLGRSVFALLHVSPGFDPRNVLTIRVNGQEPRYQRREAARAMHDELLERIAALPGVSGAATISQLPLAGAGNSGSFAIQSAPATDEVPALIRTISHNYFDVMGVPRLEGRGFSPADTVEAPRVVLVNEALARTVFGGRAIGQRIAFPFFAGRPWWEIVGVVSNEQFIGLDRPMRPVVYFAATQDSSNSFSVVVRTTTAPETLAAPVREAAGRLDPMLPVYQLESLEQIISRSDGVHRRRSALVLLAVFAVAALGLAAVGVYGLLAHTVAHRTRELGIRIALGADRRDVMRTVAARGIRLIAAGTLAGVMISAISARSLESLLFHIASIDPVSLGAAAAFLASIAALAGVVPALRAARIDPAVALRGDVE